MTPAAVEAAVQEVRPQDQKIDSASADANWEALAKYGTDLTAKVRLSDAEM